MKKLLIPLVSLGLAVGCGGDVPTASLIDSPNLAASAVQSGASCHGVRGFHRGDFR